MSGSFDEFKNEQIVPTPNENYVDEHTVKDLMVDKHNIIRVKDSDLVSIAFHKLQQNKVLSLPVYDETKHRFYGFLDVLDIVTYILKITDAYKHNKKTTWMEFLSTESLWRDTTCGTVKNISQNDLYTQIMPEANITTAISLMANFDGMHRLAVVGPYPDYQLLGLLSQSEVVKYLYKHLDHKEKQFTQTVGEIKLGYRQVLSIKPDVQLSKAFHLLKEKKVSGIAVVNNEGSLIGNISASDIRGGKEFSIDSLVDFCAQTVGQYLENRPKSDKPYPVTVSPKDTILDVMKSIIDNHIHRVYVLDGVKLVGVITLADILRLFHPRKVVYAGY